MIIAASFDLNDHQFLLNRGLAYGDGLFETMRLCNGKLPLLDWHMKRLSEGLNRLQLQPFDTHLLLAALRRYLDAKGQTSGIVKLTVFRSNQSRGYRPTTEHIDWVLSLDEMPAMAADQTLRLGVAKQKMASIPLLAGMKHLSRLEQVLLSQELNEQTEFDDLLILDEQQNIIESTYQNVVLFRGTEIFTPALTDNGVHGVALRWLSDQFQLQTKAIKPKDLQHHDGMMVCNAIRGFRSVGSVTDVKTKIDISFATNTAFQDKITNQWNALFNA